ncbi:hypothetical protein TCAL_06068 [Tigriopus californicus]|uniref:Jacalin-type lectin domain-containing protein n=1 Tax=Tigriopus californicus TaxID=6832 RepID=A0A553PQ32_TIGCA|nr:hypothetical protein TCAL_06068 [Tigriopus californicus]|eukprot:TCALIF_06068-PA protein Name:"Similar to PF13_0198 Reticulocyte-binding protein 2 homolog a (Plasmodium falciparum (isolate 3D7))" AED:0.07 eAED:0.07 QI:71/0.5/0.33/1/1/1/3/0/812
MILSKYQPLSFPLFFLAVGAISQVHARSQDEVHPYGYADFVETLAGPSDAIASSESQVRSVRVPFHQPPSVASNGKLIPESGWLPITPPFQSSPAQATEKELLQPSPSILSHSVANKGGYERVKSKANVQDRSQAPPITVFPNDTIVIHYETVAFAPNTVHTSSNPKRDERATIPGAGTLENRINLIINNKNCIGIDVPELLTDLLRSPLRVRNQILDLLQSRTSAQSGGSQIRSSKSIGVGNKNNNNNNNNNKQKSNEMPLTVAKEVVHQQFSNFPNFQRVQQEKDSSNNEGALLGGFVANTNVNTESNKNNNNHKNAQQLSHQEAVESDRIRMEEERKKVQLAAQKRKAEQRRREEEQRRQRERKKQEQKREQERKRKEEEARTRREEQRRKEELERRRVDEQRRQEEQQRRAKQIQKQQANKQGGGSNVPNVPEKKVNQRPKAFPIEKFLERYPESTTLAAPVFQITQTTLSTTHAAVVTTSLPATPPPNRQPKRIQQTQPVTDNGPIGITQAVGAAPLDFIYGEDGELSSDEYSYLYYEDYYEELVPEHHRFDELNAEEEASSPQPVEFATRASVGQNNNQVFQAQTQDSSNGRIFPNFPPSPNANKPIKVIVSTTTQTPIPIVTRAPPPVRPITTRAPPPPVQPVASVAVEDSTAVQSGPFGYPDKGAFFSDADMTIFPSQIEVIYQGFVWAMKVGYPVANGGRMHGGVHTILKDKVKREVVRLKDDYIIRVSGRASPYNINRLTFYTAKGKKYGPWGERRSDDSVDFDVSAPPGQGLAYLSGTVDFGVPVRSISMHWRPLPVASTA